MTTPLFHLKNNRSLAVIFLTGLITILILSTAHRKMLPAAYAQRQAIPTTAPVGDLNGDGKPDIAAVKTAAGTIVLRAGKGNGTFDPPGASFPAGEVAAGLNPAQVVAADFNSDSKLDLAVTNEVANGQTRKGNVLLLFGDGQGAFSTTANYLTGGAHAGALALGDFNGDGFVDIAVTTGGVRFLLNNGSGRFTPTPDFDAGANPVAIAANDLNGDGKLDVAVGNFDSSNISILLGKGNGRFSEKTDYAANGLGVTSVSAGDYDGDGKVDLYAVSESGLAQQTVYLGEGDGTFRLRDTSMARFGVRRPLVLLGEFAGNVTTVLAIKPERSGFASGVELWDTERRKAVYQIISNPTQLAAADVNQDGSPDIVATNQAGEVTVIATPFPTYTPTHLPGPGNPTIFPTNPAWCGTPDKFTFVGAPSVALNRDTSYPRNVITGDFNRDRKLDIALAVENSTKHEARVAVMLGAGDGTFNRVGTEETDPLVGDYYSYGLAAGDLNGDRKLDLVAGASGRLTVLLGKGDGTFVAQSPIRWDGQAGEIQLADLNKDGNLDAVVTDHATLPALRVAVLYGNGNGTFGAATLYPTPRLALKIQIGDINNDEWPDILVTSTARGNPSGDGIVVLTNDGKGLFKEPTQFDTYMWPAGLCTSRPFCTSRVASAQVGRLCQKSKVSAQKVLLP